MFELLMVLAFAWAGFVHLVPEGEKTNEKEETGAGERRRDRPGRATPAEASRRLPAERVGRRSDAAGCAAAAPCRRQY